MPGFVAHYSHGEGDAVAIVLLRFRESLTSRTPEFQLLARELGMQVVAMRPVVVAPRDLDEAAWREELARLRGSPSLRGLTSEEHMLKLRSARDNYERNFCLLRQPFIKDDRLTVEDRISQAERQLSEEIELLRFSVYRSSDAQ
jgi:elongation factor Ts